MIIHLFSPAVKRFTGRTETPYKHLYPRAANSTKTATERHTEPHSAPQSILYIKAGLHYADPLL